MTAVAAIDADMRRMTRASAACRRLMTIPGVGQLTALAFVAAIDDPSGIRRSRDISAYFGLVPRRYQSGEVDYTGGISKMPGQAGANAAVRGRKRHADPLQGPAQTQGLSLRDRPAVNDAQRASRSGSSPRDHHARDAAGRNRVRVGLIPRVIAADRREPSRAFRWT
jgi:transposase